MILLSLRFFALYALLLVLAAFLREASRTDLRVLAESLSGNADDHWEMNVEPITTPEHPSVLRVTIADRSRMDRNDCGPVRNLDLDAADLIAKPLALSWALILCTPVSWGRRVAALFWCALWEQVIALLVLTFFIWNESAQLSPVALHPIAQLAAATIRQMVVAQLGLAAPVLLWIVILLRREDHFFLKTPVLPA